MGKLENGVLRGKGQICAYFVFLKTMYLWWELKATLFAATENRTLFAATLNRPYLLQHPVYGECPHKVGPKIIWDGWILQPKISKFSQ